MCVGQGLEVEKIIISCLTSYSTRAIRKWRLYYLLVSLWAFSPETELSEIQKKQWPTLRIFKPSYSRLVCRRKQGSRARNFPMSNITETFWIKSRWERARKKQLAKNLPQSLALAALIDNLPAAAAAFSTCQSIISIEQNPGRQRVNTTKSHSNSRRAGATKPIKALNSA